jgi:hypothetical protein
LSTGKLAAVPSAIAEVASPGPRDPSEWELALLVEEVLILTVVAGYGRDPRLRDRI